MYVFSSPKVVIEDLKTFFRFCVNICEVITLAINNYPSFLYDSCNELCRCLSDLISFGPPKLKISVMECMVVLLYKVDHSQTTLNSVFDTVITILSMDAFESAEVRTSFVDTALSNLFDKLIAFKPKIVQENSSLISRLIPPNVKNTKSNQLKVIKLSQKKKN